MRIKLLTLAIAAIISNLNAQKIEFESPEMKAKMPQWFQDLELNSGVDLMVINKIEPFFLEADFNGDSITDIAVSVIDTSSKKRGILIVHGGTHKSFQIGAGNVFSNGGDNFYWMDHWNIYRKSIAYQTVFSEDMEIQGQELVSIKYPAIQVSQEEGSSNLIAWAENKYIWIHTGS